MKIWELGDSEGAKRRMDTAEEEGKQAILKA
jgi:hypothetical protein